MALFPALISAGASRRFFVAGCPLYNCILNANERVSTDSFDPVRSYEFSFRIRT